MESSEQLLARHPPDEVRSLPSRIYFWHAMLWVCVTSLMCMIVLRLNEQPRRTSFSYAYTSESNASEDAVLYWRMCFTGIDSVLVALTSIGFCWWLVRKPYFSEVGHWLALEGACTFLFLSLPIGAKELFKEPSYAQTNLYQILFAFFVFCFSIQSLWMALSLADNGAWKAFSWFRAILLGSVAGIVSYLLLQDDIGPYSHIVREPYSMFEFMFVAVYMLWGVTLFTLFITMALDSNNRKGRHWSHWLGASVYFCFHVCLGISVLYS